MSEDEAYKSCTSTFRSQLITLAASNDVDLVTSLHTNIHESWSPELNWVHTITFMFGAILLKRSRSGNVSITHLFIYTSPLFTTQYNIVCWLEQYTAEQVICLWQWIECYTTAEWQAFEKFFFFLNKKEMCNGLNANISLVSFFSSSTQHLTFILSYKYFVALNLHFSA